MLKHVLVSVSCMVLAILLFATPLYLKYHVYIPRQVTINSGDTVQMPSHYSTAWCESKTFQSESIFDAYTMTSTPEVITSDKEITYASHRAVLPENKEEIWGFQLLKGSSLTVFSCVRLPRASITLLRGHAHLHRCLDESRVHNLEVLANAKEQSDSDSDEGTSSSSEGRFLNDSSILSACRDALRFGQMKGPYVCNSRKRNTEMNSLFSFDVEDTDFYYFLVQSDTYLDIVPNEVLVDVVLSRTKFNFSQSVSSCENITGCDLPVSWWGGEHTFVRIPAQNGSWYAITVQCGCEMRKGLLFVFYFGAAIVVFLCAFY